jgi:hypothetical protein
MRKHPDEHRAIHLRPVGEPQPGAPGQRLSGPLKQRAGGIGHPFVKK